VTARRLSPLVFVAIAGCVSTPGMPEPSASHPASPLAHEAAPAPRSATLAIPRSESESEPIAPETRGAPSWPQRPATPWFDCAPDDGAISETVRGMLREPLTEESAVRIAVLNNREARAAYEELGIARAELVQAGLLRNPVFEGALRFFSSGTTVELGLTQAFLDAFAIPMRRCVAASNLAAARASVSRRMVRLAFDVRRAFVRHRAAAERVEMRRKSLEVMVGSLDLMRQLNAAGNATEVQLAAAEEPAAHERLQLAAAEAAAAESREPLNVLLGLWGDGIAWTAAPGRLEEAGAIPAARERCESLAVAASFDLAEARAHAEGTARRAGLASWDAVFPGIAPGLSAEREIDGRWGVGPALEAEIPVFDQGDARVAAARAELRRELALFTTVAVEVRSAARRLRDRVASLEERAAFMTKVHMPLQDRLLRETLKVFNAMQIGAFEVLLARGRQIAGEVEHLQTLEDLALARLDLAELIAGALNRERVNQAPDQMGDHGTEAGGQGGHHR
jgi:cobalt-zinc-cadmium efflux system outer membrane protein